MPQMMPINWIFSFFFFICIFIMFNIFNYYIFSYKKNIFPYKNIFKKKIIYWKW